MAIDRMDWHYGNDGFPDDVPEENAGVHIGFFLTWAFEQGLAGDIHTEEEPEAIAQLLCRARRQWQFCAAVRPLSARLQ